MIASLLPRRGAPWHDPGVSALGIHHVGIAVRDLEDAPRPLRAALRRARSRRASASRNRAWRRSRCCSARTAASSCWRRSREDTPVGRFLARRGEGMHHLAFGVDDLRGRARAAARGRRDADRRAAAHGHLRGRGIRAPRVARRRAERAGPGDDGEGGVMADTASSSSSGSAAAARVAGEASAEDWARVEAALADGRGHGRHRARRAPHLGAHRGRRLRRARRAAPPGRGLQLVDGGGRSASACSTAPRSGTRRSATAGCCGSPAASWSRIATDRAWAVPLVAAVVWMTLGLNYVIKRLVRRERPLARGGRAPLIRPPASPSFPSSHAAMAAAGAVALSVVRAGRSGRCSLPWPS